MRYLYSTLCCLVLSLINPSVTAQGYFSNPVLTNVFSGNYEPQDFEMVTDYGKPEDLVAEMQEAISPDSLKSYLVAMQQFRNRNSGSDTLAENGIGAARNWVVAQFQRFSQSSDDRLVTGFFEFDIDICGILHHKNAVAMLPGSDPDKGIIIIEAHLDSRCEDVCDITCLAQGMEDNGSGVALVLELARVMSRYNYPSTIVFMATTGEEQGLVGAEALAEYALQQNIRIRMVQNNDIVGGIICGETSSAPSCPGLNHIDSTQVRLFSEGGFDSPHKGVCRFIKLQYEEMLKPISHIPMRLTIMTAEDRQGRGGDHIPFRERDFPAMRFTSANEHGDAGIDEDYHDRQHTTGDILGLDKDGDDILDTFFVDFNYLARNTAINGTSALMAAIGPESPYLTGFYSDGHEYYVEIGSDIPYPEYRVGVRTDFTDFDTIHTIKGTNAATFQTTQFEFFLFLSVMAVDSNGVESIPYVEERARYSGTEDTDKEERSVYLQQNKPNPFDESTMISYWVETPFQYDRAEIVIMDLSGKVVESIETTPQQGINEAVYFHGYGVTGAYVYALVVDGRVVDERRMVFAN